MDVKRSMLSKDVSRPSSPSPSLCASVLEKYISTRECKDGFVRVSSSSDTTCVSSPSSSSLPSSFVPCDVKSKDDSQRSEGGSSKSVDLASVFASLPADGRVREQFLTQCIKSGIGLVQDPSKGLALSSNWRDPSEGAAKASVNYTYGHTRVDLPTGGVGFPNPNNAFINLSGLQTAMCTSVSRLGTSTNPNVWNRTTNAVDFHHISAKYICHCDLATNAGTSFGPTPMVNVPPVIYNFMVFVDTLALLSNATPSQLIPPQSVVLYDGNLQGQTDNDVFSIFDCSGSAPYGSQADAGQTYATCMPSKASMARFKILYHRQEVMHVGDSVYSYGANGVSLGIGQGAPRMHTIDLKLDPPVRCVYESNSSLATSPYINNIYVCCWANIYTAGTTGQFNNIVPFVNCSIRADWKDVGDPV